jgi:hypothetical protein
MVHASRIRAGIRGYLLKDTRADASFRGTVLAGRRGGMDGWQGEVIKAVLAFGVAAASLLVGSSLGQRLTARWDDRKKRRELELAALSEFYRLYGDFFAVWKAWETYKPRPGRTFIRPEAGTAWQLLERACAVEGGFESLLVKVALEHDLCDAQIVKLARFRQGHQSLREAIREDRRLDWRAQPGLGDASDKYSAFKLLATSFAALLASAPAAPASTCAHPG